MSTCAHRRCRVPYLPEVCVAIDIPKTPDLGLCSTCPQYGPLGLNCTGWTSAPATIRLPSGVSKSGTKYTSTGCANQTLAPPDAGVPLGAMQTNVDVFYAAGGQDPLRIVVRQDLWENLPQIGPVHTVDSSTYDITHFQVGSLSPALFRHCTPSSG